MASEMAAGGSGRTTASTTPSRPARPRVRDFTGATPTFAVEWDVRPAFDSVFSLASEVASTDDLPAADKAWLKDAIAGLPKDARTYLGDERQRDVLVHIAPFLVERPNIRSASDVAAGVKAATPTELFGNLLGGLTEHHGVDSADLDRALAGDRAAAASIRRGLKGSKGEALGSIVEDPAHAHEQLAAVFEAWAVAFGQIEARVASIIERDVELREGDRSSLSEVELVEKTTGGIRIVPDPAIQRVFLAPSYFARPFNYLFAGPGWRLAGYPVADAALDIDPLTPPASVLRLHQALGDSTRLRILKALAEKDLYGTELAAQLDLSKPTVSHHMAQLRAAGLVTAVQAGSAVYYSLRRERLQDALTDLTRFLVS